MLIDFLDRRKGKDSGGEREGGRERQKEGGGKRGRLHRETETLTGCLSQAP